LGGIYTFGNGNNNKNDIPMTKEEHKPKHLWAIEEQSTGFHITGFGVVIAFSHWEGQGGALL
jgi:hypothetical protein